MKKLVKPEIYDLENVVIVKALCESCDACNVDIVICPCNGNPWHWWADDDKDEILF